VAVRDEGGGAAGLGPRPLLVEQELPAGVIDIGLVEVDHDLQWKYELAVEVAATVAPRAASTELGEARTRAGRDALCSPLRTRRGAITQGRNAPPVSLGVGNGHASVIRPFSTLRIVVPVNRIVLPVPAGRVPIGMSSNAAPVWVPPPIH